VQSDARLVELARAGHEPALTAIVQRYRTALVRYCTGLLGADRAEDAVQQALANAHTALTAPDDRPLELRPWLYRLAHNAALNVLRASRDQAFADGGTAGAGEPPEEVLARRQRFDELLAAIAALPCAQRDSLLLRELEGRSHEEIASALGVSVGAVRQKLFRARAAVRAACTAVTPGPLLARLIEHAAAPAGGAALTKAAAGVLATGALAGGAASTGVLSGDHPRAPAERAQAEAAKVVSEAAAHEPSPPAGERLARVSSPQREASRRSQPVARDRSPAAARARKTRGHSEPTRSRQSTDREGPAEQEAGGKDPRAAGESRHQGGENRPEDQPWENSGRGDEPETPTAGRETGPDRNSPNDGRSQSQSAPGGGKPDRSGGKPDSKSPGGGQPGGSRGGARDKAGGARPNRSGGKSGSESPGRGKPNESGGLPGNAPTGGGKPNESGGKPGNESPGAGQPNESGGKPGNESPGGGQPNESGGGVPGNAPAGGGTPGESVGKPGDG
jgi:RNA polymerase sigma factor (sigma-70 family)